MRAVGQLQVALRRYPVGPLAACFVLVRWSAADADLLFPLFWLAPLFLFTYGTYVNVQAVLARPVSRAKISHDRSITPATLEAISPLTNQTKPKPTSQLKTNNTRSSHEALSSCQEHRPGHQGPSCRFRWGQSLWRSRRWSSQVPGIQCRRGRRRSGRGITWRELVRYQCRSPPGSRTREALTGQMLIVDAINVTTCVQKKELKVEK